MHRTIHHHTIREAIDTLLPYRAAYRTDPADGGDGGGDGGGGGAGGDGDGDGDGDGSGDGDGDGEGDGDGSGDGDGDGSGDGDGDSGDAALRARATEAEATAARANRRAGEEERKRKKLEKEAKERAQREQQDQGQFKDLYEQEKQAREEQDGKIKSRLLKSSIRSQAAAQKFLNPDVAHRLVDLDPNDVVDDDFEVNEDAVKSALESLAKTNTYLVNKAKAQKDDLGGSDGRRSGGQGSNGNGGTPPTSSEDPSQWNPAETMRQGYAGGSS